MAITKRTRMPRTQRGRITRLERLRTDYSSPAQKLKIGLLEALMPETILDPDLLSTYHETLLFLRAYPDSPRILSLVEEEAARFHERVESLRTHDPDAAKELDDSGIASTTTRYWYDLATLEALHQRYPGAIEIDWEEYETPERIDALLPLIAEALESDSLDLSDMDTEEWLDFARGRTRTTSLGWLLEGLGRLRGSHKLHRLVFDALEVPLRWELSDSDASRTHARSRYDTPHFHEQGLLRRVDDFRREIRRPLHTLEPLPPAEGQEMIHTVRTALAVRHRALYPIEYASPEDVLVAECARGYQLVLFGMLPSYRLPIESDYGALILKNGQIIGYGVGAMLFEQVEIAVNIFDTWRGGESAFIFSQFVRAFHQHFGGTRFKIERYQVGYENDEGLKSGSFWFYHKLGFVPQLPEVRELAQAEVREKKRNPGHRSTMATLKKLALSDMFFSLRGDPARIPPAFPLARLSEASSRLIAERFEGDRRLARRRCADEAARHLRCRSWKSWPADEKMWFERLSLLVVQIPGLAHWPTRERRALVALIRSKGKAGESEFVSRLRDHKALRRALHTIVN